MPSLSLSLARRRRLAVGLVLLVLAVVAWQHVGGRSSSAPTGGADAGRAPIVPRIAQPRAPAKQLVVDVVGAVRSPGLYRLASGARVADAVQAAGGLTARADPMLVNLAALVADGQQVLVAARGVAVAGGGAPSPSATSPPAPVDLNSATAEELDALPGVGPVTAQKIIQYREQHGPFTSAAGLDAIPGIGPARIDQLKGLVVP